MACAYDCLGCCRLTAKLDLVKKTFSTVEAWSIGFLLNG